MLIRDVLEMRMSGRIWRLNLGFATLRHSAHTATANNTPQRSCLHVVLCIFKLALDIDVFQ